MRLFTFENADMVPVDPQYYSRVWHVNLDCVAYVQEIRRKPTLNNPRPAASWHVRVDGSNFDVTEAAFQRIQQAMLESK